MSGVAGRIAENLAHIRERIAAAARASGRTPESVTLVAVTKSTSLEVIQALADAGCADFGESRPQELWTKAATLAHANVRWHMIGHLQRNKIRRTLPLVHLIHSVDSRRLIDALDAEAAPMERTADVLLEVNISGDASKTGLSPVNVAEIIRAATELPHLSIRGLMGMASLTGGEAAAARDFARLRELAESLRRQLPAGVSLAELSMGMSSDFEIAIREGATIVRVGSALVEGAEP